MTCNTNLFLYSIIIVFVVCLSPNISCTVPVACHECDRLLFTCSFCISLYRLWESNVCNAFFFLVFGLCVCLYVDDDDEYTCDRDVFCPNWGAVFVYRHSCDISFDIGCDVL